MNEHDMISNISYIMRLYPETTEEILIKHGADPSKEYWTDGCDVASAYDELLQWLNSRYDRNDLETELDYHIQEILGWHDVNESVESDFEIPAPYNQYYEFSPNEVNYEELPDAFDHYKELKVIAELYAKEQYEDALANNCLDFCWLVEDEIGKLLLVTTAGLRVYPITLEEVLECVSLNEDSVDWRSRKASVDTIELDSRINRIIKRIDLDGRVPKIMKRHYKPNFVRYDIGIGTVGQKEASDYESRVAIPAYEHMRDAFEKQGWKVFFQPSVGMRGNLSWTDFYVQVRIPYSSISNDTNELSDYEESLVEDIEMSDAQRLALQELDAALDCGELDAEKHALAYQIQWDINFEDVVLFINGIDIDLKDIEHVAYGDCDETKFDGCYSVTLRNGEVKKYGWHDFDMTGSLTCIDCNEAVEDNKLTEADDGWDKPFNWTERYVKDGFVITGNYDRTSWHLEQTRPRTKHFGNYKTLEAAKVAGDKEIAAKNAGNRGKEPQFGVHQFSTDSIIFRGTEEECGNYIDGREHLWDDAEIYMIMPDDPNYRDLNEETASRRFNPGDRVYVTVSNRQGTVNKMISDDVVEVEFEANGTYPARIDRFYTDEVELIFSDDLDDDF